MMMMMMIGMEGIDSNVMAGYLYVSVGSVCLFSSVLSVGLGYWKYVIHVALDRMTE
jgi:hypothetical protein